MLRIGILTSLLAAALAVGPARAQDANWIDITGTLVAETGVGSWFGDPLAFYGDCTATGSVEDEGLAYCHGGGTFAMIGADGIIAFSLQAPDTYGIYMQPWGTWTIVYASGAYEGLQGCGIFTASWELVVPSWEADLYRLEIELEGYVAHAEPEPEPEPDPGPGDDDPAPTKPGKGKGKNK